MCHIAMLYAYCRFCVQSDGLVDECIEPPLELGVRQLIEQRQLEHQERFLETQTHHFQAKSLYDKQESLRQAVLNRLDLTVPHKDARHRVMR